jgi:hypothetical protein
MRSQVQVLAGPPPILAGQSAVGSEPGALAASLGRAGAARPSRRAAHWPLPGPSTGASGSTTTTHRGRTPSPGRQPRGRCGNLALHPAPVPLRGRSHGRSGQRAGLVAQRSSAAAAARTQSGPVHRRHPLTNTRARQHRRVQACSAVDRAARRRGRRPGVDPFLWCGCPPHRPSPHRHRLKWEETEASGQTGADTSRLDAGRVDTRGLDARRRHQVTGQRTGWTPDGWTTGPRTTSEWVDTAWSAPTGDRRYGGRPGSAGHGDDARPLDAGWTLRRADAVWASHDSGPLSSKDSEGHHAATDGPGQRRDGQLLVIRRRPAGAAAHCCPRTITGRG